MNVTRNPKSRGKYSIFRHAETVRKNKHVKFSMIFIAVKMTISSGSSFYLLNSERVNPYTCKPDVPLWDIYKQNKPRCDAAKRGVPSGAILFA